MFLLVIRLLFRNFYGFRFPHFRINLQVDVVCLAQLFVVETHGLLRRTGLSVLHLAVGTFHLLGHFHSLLDVLEADGVLHAQVFLGVRQIEFQRLGR